MLLGLGESFHGMRSLATPLKLIWVPVMEPLVSDQCKVGAKRSALEPHAGGRVLGNSLFDVDGKGSAVNLSPFNKATSNQ